MATFYSEMERIIKANGERGLEQLLFYNGVDLEIYRDRKVGPYSTVHNANSGGIQELEKKIVGILVSDDFFPSTNAARGNFTQGFLITKDPAILVGDEIRLCAEDGALIAYKVDRKESLGQTITVFTRYKISNTLS